MHLYKHFFKLIGKNKTGLIIYLGIFVAMIVCVAYATSGTPDASDVVSRDSYKIGYVDKDGSALSKGIIEFLSENNDMTDMSDRDEDSIKTMVFFEAVDYVLEIPEDYEEHLKNEKKITVDYYVGTSFSASTYIISNGIDMYVKDYMSYLKLGMNETDAAKAATENMRISANISRYVENSTGTSEGGNDVAVYNLINYFAYVSFGAIVVCFGGVLVINSKKEIADRMHTAPVSEKRKVLTDFTGVFSAGLLLLVFFAIFLLIFGRNSEIVNQHFYKILLVELGIVVFNCSFAVFVAGFRVKSEALSIISNITGLSMSFISGIFVPQYLLGDVVIHVAKFTPFYWLCRLNSELYGPANSEIAYSGSELLLSFSMIMLFAAAFLLGGILVRKQRATA